MSLAVLPAPGGSQCPTAGSLRVEEKRKREEEGPHQQSLLDQDLLDKGKDAS